MSQLVTVREVDALEPEVVGELLRDHPYDDYRRHRRIAPDAALAFLRERAQESAAAERCHRLLARDRSDGRPAGVLMLQYLSHDSELLGRPMGGIPFLLVRADHPDPGDVLRALLLSLPYLVQREGYSHVSVRIDSADIAAYHELTDAGFRLMETLVSMAYDTERRGIGVIDPAEFGFDGVVRTVEPRDHDAVAEMSRKRFTLNRYHLDQSISHEAAGELMARWARSYCENDQDCQVWVAEGKGGELAGFLGHQLNRGLEKHSGILVSGRALLAVEDPRTGVGQMLSRAHTWQSPGDYKEADTQLNNYGMIKASFKLDMDMVRTKYTFHR
ncbi:hypothetical protein [Engelhardtia mirabilis]|uniref:N-acetyltransferase domain-containing protein n=1 Tax=Engelhardtia mirabilis TaxID=2528011 RepID=A0A518BEU5_9BACT|nr:hypothetical protein Pla133_05510 [Planctomycetes bacterium Pla133]QDU99812.1 hypothetical protein Pla86_05510 [Planctomycetes bacterium Pla86]